MNRTIWSGILLLGGAGTAAAADAELDYFQEFPVVLSASRLSQPLEDAPNALTVIDRKMIEDSGYRTVPELMRLVPGFYVGYADATAPFVAYHGTTDQLSRRMQVLLDGKSIYMPPYGGVHWAELPISVDDIERIEVIRGPAAASHGANSLQGVISITTRDALAERGAHLQVLGGNGGQAETGVAFSHSGERMDYRLSAGYRRDNGYDFPVLNDGSRTALLNLRANYRPTLEDTVELRVGASDSRRDIGIVGRPSEPFRSLYSNSSYQQVDWIRALAGGGDLKIGYANMTYDYWDNGPAAIDNDVAHIRRQDLTLQHTLELAQNRMVWGGLWRENSTDNLVAFGQRRVLRQAQLFGHDEWRMAPDWLANIGAMLETDGLGHTRLSPRLALNYTLARGQTLRAGYSVGYRNPVMFEEFARTQYLTGRPYNATGGLIPERMASAELGYLGSFPSSRVTLEGRVYVDKLTNMIFLDPLLNYDFSFSNLYGARYEGFEGVLTYQLNQGNTLRMQYARQNARCEILGTMTFAAFTPLLQEYMDGCARTVPAHSGSLGYNATLGHYRANATYFVQSPVQVLDAQEPQSWMHRVDVRVARPFGQQGKAGSGEVALVVQNLFGDRYTEYTNMPEKMGFVAERRFWLNSRWAF